MRPTFQKKIGSIIPKNKAFIPVKIFLPVFLLCILCGVSALSAEESFFSYKRFFINEKAFSSGKNQGLIQRDLENFIRKFNEGLYYISSEKYTEAQKSFYRARQLWPEYYATDLFLAQAYEEDGKYRVAARYYKSYLKKLNKLRSGSYRLTGALMVSLSPGGIVSYDAAYSYVRGRLEAYDIDIDKVIPAFEPFGMLLTVITNLAGIGLVIFLYRKLKPYWHRQKRILNTPEGFWACRNCGAYNPYLRNECEQCGRDKP